MEVDFLLEGTWETEIDVAPTEGPSITAVADFSTKNNYIFIEDLGFPDADALAWYIEGTLPNRIGKRGFHLGFHHSEVMSR